MKGSDLTKIHKVSNSDLQRPRLMFSSLRQILFKTRTIALHQRSYTLIVKFQARMGVGTRHDQPDPDCWAWVRAEGSSQGSLLEQKHQWASWVSCMNICRIWMEVLEMAGNCSSLSWHLPRPVHQTTAAQGGGKVLSNPGASLAVIQKAEQHLGPSDPPHSQGKSSLLGAKPMILGLKPLHLS